MTEQKRQTSRRVVFESDQMKCKWKYLEQNFQGFVTDMCPYGVGIETKEDLSKIQKGDLVSFSYIPRKKEQLPFKPIEAVVSYIVQEDSSFRLGLHFIGQKTSSHEESYMERRKTGRINTSSFFRPTAVCESPFFFHEKAFFNILQFSGNGLTTLTSSSHTFLTMGLTVLLNINIPLLGQFVVNVLIRTLLPGEEKETLKIGFELIDPSSELLQGLGAYALMTHPELSLTELKEAKLQKRVLENALYATHPSSEDELFDILRLRLKSYQHLGLLKEATPLDLLEEHDSWGRQVMICLGKRVVACGRILFYDGLLERGKLPLYFKVPPLDLMHLCEVTSVCIDPDFQKTDVFPFLMKTILRIALQSDMKYIIMEARPEIAPMYKKLGFESLGEPLEHPWRGSSWIFHPLIIYLNQDKDTINKNRYQEIIISPILSFLENS